MTCILNPPLQYLGAKTYYFNLKFEISEMARTKVCSIFSLYQGIPLSSHNISIGDSTLYVLSEHCTIIILN